MPWSVINESQQNVRLQEDNTGELFLIIGRSNHAQVQHFSADGDILGSAIIPFAGWTQHWEKQGEREVHQKNYLGNIYCFAMREKSGSMTFGYRGPSESEAVTSSLTMLAVLVGKFIAILERLGLRLPGGNYTSALAMPSHETKTLAESLLSPR